MHITIIALLFINVYAHGWSESFDFDRSTHIKLPNKGLEKKQIRTESWLKQTLRLPVDILDIFQNI